MFDELKQSCRTQGYGGFLPGMKQIGNVAALPGIVGVSVQAYTHIHVSNMIWYNRNVALLKIKIACCCIKTFGATMNTVFIDLTSYLGKTFF